MTGLIERLLAMYSHRGDGIPTQYVNPDGPEAAHRIEALEAALRQVEEWWLREGMHCFIGAPACIFAVRSALNTLPPLEPIK